MATESNRPVIKRKLYLVSRPFQLKYVGIILALMFLTAALCSWVVYYSAMLHLGDKLANVYPQGRLMAIVNAVNFRILLSIILMTPLVALIGILLSHKIAGPIYRLERILNNMSLGDLTAYVALRKGDELATLADGINNVTNSVKATIVNQKDGLGRMSGEINNLRRLTASVPHANDSINKLDQEISCLSKEIEKYKV